MNLKEKAEGILAKVLAHFTDLEVVKGKGSYLYGADGKKYLDFASGIAVTNTGHCHPQIVTAAVAQTKKLIHNCAGVTYNPTNIKFADELKKIVPIRDARIFLGQSGSEAIEGCLKAAKYASKKSGIIALKTGFHGRTMGALSVTTSKNMYREGYGELMPNTFIAEHNLDAIKSLNNGNIAAIIFELVQGEGGYVALDKNFVQEIRKYCTDNKIYLIIDEVQSGFGRTGKMFACEWYDLEPDLIALAKGIASGFPLGAVVMKKEIADLWQTSAHGGTFTGNLVSCAAGIATIKILRKEMAKMTIKTKQLIKGLDQLIKKYPKIFVGRSGLGFMIGFQVRNAETNKNIRNKALEAGLLLISCGPDGDKIRLAPPVTVSLAEINKALKILDQVAGGI